MTHWFSSSNLEQAWKYTINEVRDDFVFDIINYEDLKLIDKLN